MIFFIIFKKAFIYKVVIKSQSIILFDNIVWLESRLESRFFIRKRKFPFWSSFFKLAFLPKILCFYTTTSVCNIFSIDFLVLSFSKASDEAIYKISVLGGYGLLENRMCCYKISKKLSWKIWSVLMIFFHLENLYVL